MKKLTAELRKLESHEDVQKAYKRLKKRFDRIADLALATRQFPRPGEPQEETAAGVELFAELARIYEIPGARGCIEAAQSEAVHRLDRKSNFEN